jgi:hypothetical protein
MKLYLSKLMLMTATACLLNYSFSFNAIAKDTDCRKRTVQAGIGVVGAVGSFFSFGAWDVSAAIHIFAIQVSNEIKLGSHAKDIAIPFEL